MRASIRYFTGTGNTARAAELLREEFEAAQWQADAQELTTGRDAYAGIEGADLLVVAFPALGFCPPVALSRWIAKLPRSPKRKAAVLCVGGATFVRGLYIPGWGADAPFSAARKLARRGREIVGIAEVSYPENFTMLSNPPDDDQSEEIRRRNDPAVRGFARELVRSPDGTGPGEPPILKRSAIARLLVGIVGALFRLGGRRVLARLLVADETCTGCGYCVRACPVKAIRLRKGEVRWSLRCVACNRCVNVCPSGSIVASSAALALHLAFSVAAAAAALSVPLPQDLLPAGRGAIRALLLAAGLFAQLGPFSFLVGALARVPALEPFFRRSFMKRYRRYRAPDFRPGEERT